MVLIGTTLTALVAAGRSWASVAQTHCFWGRQPRKRTQEKRTAAEIFEPSVEMMPVGATLTALVATGCSGALRAQTHPDWCGSSSRIEMRKCSTQSVNLIGAPTTLATLVEAVGSWARATRSTQLDALEAFS